MAGAQAPKKFDVGGQAVIEGVMMRSPTSLTVVCRRQDGSIVIKEQEWRPIWSRLSFLRVPPLRGAVVLLESMVNGISALTFSANQQMIEPADTDTDADRPARSLGARAASEPNEPSKLETVGMVIISVAFALALFVGAPHLAAWALGGWLGFDTSSFWFHAVDGVIKLIILVSYMAAISLLPDIRRVFQYHGAEHMAIFAYEAGLPLTVESARKQSRFHPRCGTSFLLIVIMVSVVLFSAVLTYRLHDNTLVDHLLKIGIKIPLMFPIAGIAYELIKLSGKRYERSALARMFSKPGMWLQNITTRVPDDSQLEVACISIRKTLWREAAGDDALPIGVQGIEVYACAADIDLPLTA